MYKNVSSRDVKKFLKCGDNSIVVRDNWVGFVEKVFIFSVIFFASFLSFLFFLFLSFLSFLS